MAFYFWGVRRVVFPSRGCTWCDWVSINIPSRVVRQRVPCCCSIRSTSTCLSRFRYWIRSRSAWFRSQSYSMWSGIPLGLFRLIWSDSVGGEQHGNGEECGQRYSVRVCPVDHDPWHRERPQGFGREYTRKVMMAWQRDVPLGSEKYYNCSIFCLLAPNQIHISRLEPLFAPTLFFYTNYKIKIKSKYGKGLFFHMPYS